MIMRRSACRYERLKWRSDSGPTVEMPVYWPELVSSSSRPLGGCAAAPAPRPSIVGQFLDRELGLEHVLPGSLPAPCPRRPAVALADALAAGVVDEVGDLEVRDGDRDDPLALPADQLLPAQVLAQLLADAAADDLPETVDIGLNPRHAVRSPVLSPC